MTHHFKKCI